MPDIGVKGFLAEGVAKGEPVRQNAWEVLIEQLGGSELALFAQTCTLPNPSIPQIEIPHFNEKTKIAGGPAEFPNISLEIIDTVDPDTARKIWEWYSLVYNPETSAIGFASEYKKQGSIVQYDSKGNQLRTWKASGLWPTSINYGQADYSSGEPLRIALELSCDRVVLE